MAELMNGIIVKSLSGFYYVKTEDGKTVECRARGRFRHDGITPLVGDRVEFTSAQNGKGYLSTIMERTNSFIRPPVANVDVMVMVAANVNPVTDPFLIDRVTVLAEYKHCETVLCINKCDLDPGDRLFDLYTGAGIRTIRTSAVTGQGIDELAETLKGRICAFTGNSGVGKSSILNALEPGFSLKTAEVSEKLGRGRHTTRHVELFELSNGTVIADTPGFSAFDIEQMDAVRKDELQYSFSELGPFLGKCRFADCSHLKEQGCAVLDAVKRGDISASRYDSYVRLYEQASKLKDWEIQK